MYEGKASGTNWVAHTCEINWGFGEFSFGVGE